MPNIRTHILKDVVKTTECLCIDVFFSDACIMRRDAYAQAEYFTPRPVLVFPANEAQMSFDCRKRHHGSYREG
jgi:hypothetical protein